MNELQFEPFCGLHYTSESDILSRSDRLDAFTDKSFILNTYINYFTNLCCAMFKCNNLPDNIDNDFVIRTLISKGSIAFFDPKGITGLQNDEKYKNYMSLQAQPFITNKTFNVYGIPTSISLITAKNCDTLFDGKSITDSNYFEVVRLNPMATSLYPVIYYFCNKIVETQRAIDVNVYNNQTPLIFEGTQEQKTTILEAIKKWSAQVKHIVLNKSAGMRAEDLFKVHNTSVEWKADKMTDVMQYYKSEFFTMIGINHTPYEKRANMVKDEVRSNAHILRLTVDSMLNEMNECASKVNKKFNTTIYFTYDMTDLYNEEIISKADSKLTANIIDENKAKEEKIEEIEFKNMNN